ncbi:MAG: lysophospholipase [Myxococcales bacterium]|nr:lysophospholipase [Myxococcales bacterium]
MEQSTTILKTIDGLRIFCRELLVDAPRAELLIVHGFGEHSGRYGHVMSYFAERGYSASAIDVRGHGRSDGRRGHCDRFSAFYDDVDALVDHVRGRASGAPLVLVAHSHGGLVGLGYSVNRDHPFAALVVSAPLLRLKLPVPIWKTAAARFLSRVAPSLALGNEIRSEDLTHDPQMVAAHKADDLCLEVATSRWYTEMVAAQGALVDRVAELVTPLLLMQGSADKLVDPEATRHFFELVPAESKELQWYDGFYHEIFNETDRARVLADVERWLGTQLPETRAAEAHT